MKLEKLEKIEKIENSKFVSNRDHSPVLGVLPLICISRRLVMLQKKALSLARNTCQGKYDTMIRRAATNGNNCCWEKRMTSSCDNSVTNKTGKTFFL